MAQAHNPVLAGSKALVVGSANGHSIAYGCANAFRSLGADLAIAYPNDKARPHVALRRPKRASQNAWKMPIAQISGSAPYGFGPAAVRPVVEVMLLPV